MDRGALSRTLAVAALLFVAECTPTAGGPLPVAPVVATSVTAAEDTAPSPMGPPRPDPELLLVPWAKALSPLAISCANTGAKAAIRLYGDDGSIDRDAAETFSRVASDTNGEFPLSDRLLQLAVKAAHHFDAKTLVVVSAYRKPRTRSATDHHSKGEALDFRLPGVDYRQLAAYLRSLPRVGVGVYTDPRTRYVHLDVRDRSFYWLDASPPGVVWREAAIGDGKQAARDASYTTDSDLPLDGRDAGGSPLAGARPSGSPLAGARPSGPKT
jgi:uncharacterized protein YcbK (DUF882 family)